jgi:transposase
MLGVDIARLTFTAARWEDGHGASLGTFPNTPAGFAALAEAVGPTDPVAAPAVTLEPTGGYELPLALWAVEQGWTVHVPNPHHVRAWATGIGQRAKTDRQDALLLARYGAERALPPWQPLPTELSELESLVRRKDDLAQLLRQERNRQHALSVRPGVARAVPASVERVIGLLEEELRQVEEAIAAHLQAHATLQETLALLRTVPGIGERTAVPVLVTLGRWDTRPGGAGSAKALVAYVGLDPRPHESGTSVHQRPAISRQGDRVTRCRLYLSAVGGIRGHTPLQTFYQHLLGQHKPKKLALVAAARKILIWAWAVYRQQTAFDPARASATPCHA